MTVPTGFCVCVAEGHPELCPNTPGRCAFKCAEYSAGKLKPAYPMPAIPISVEYFPTGMLMFEWNKAKDFSEYKPWVYHGI